MPTSRQPLSHQNGGPKSSKKNFAGAAENPPFLAAVKDFTRRFEKPVKNYFEDLSGPAIFAVDVDTAINTVAAEQAGLLNKNIFLFRTGDYRSANSVSNIAMLMVLPMQEKDAAFRAAVGHFHQRLGKPVAFKNAGTLFKGPPDTIRQIIKKDAPRYRKQNVELSAMVLDNPAAEPAYLALFPTADKYQILAALGTAAHAEGTGPVIDTLRQIESKNPFNLRFISYEVLEGEFTAPVKSPEKVAAQLYGICSEVDNPKALVRQLKKSRRLFLWWD